MKGTTDQPAERHAPRRLRTLVVEDSPVAMQAVANLLQTHPAIEVVGMAWNGQDGLALAEQCQPDLVFADMEMPIVGGLQLAEALRKKPSPVRIVVLSTHEGFVWQKLSVMRGADAFVTKHRLPAELASLIARLFPDVATGQPADPVTN